MALSRPDIHRDYDPIAETSVLIELQGTLRGCEIALNTLSLIVIIRNSAGMNTVPEPYESESNLAALHLPERHKARDAVAWQELLDISMR